MSIALVTGGSSGIGLGIVKRFLAEGWQVLVFDLNPVPEELAAGQVTSIQLDLSQEAAIINAFQCLGDTYPHLDVLVNCAGTIEQKAPLESITIQEFLHVLQVNLLGPVMVCKYGLESLKKSRYPSIINIGSISGTEKASEYLAYASSKGGLYSFTQSLAKTLAPYRIRVNMVSPGSVVDTGFYKLQYGHEISFEDKITLMKQAPMKKLNDPKSIADVVYFLASEAARSITGLNVVVDGGLTL